MSIAQFIFIIFTVIALSTGQILFKMSAGSFEISMSGLVKALQNPKLIAAIIVYFFATIMWLLVLKVTPLRVAYPFAALAFIIVPLLAHFILGEAINWKTFAGAALIAFGILVSTHE